MEQKIIEFFSIIDREVQELQYGTITGTVLVQDGLPVVQTLNLVLSKRKRYKRPVNNEDEQLLSLTKSTTTHDNSEDD